ncbi:UvrD-helicase domain-containing protein [Ferrovibrio sp.]|uniref:UvrD-helicase domain-containing protein n=1 Tax=Ferrovibrio sp. TaxID=1917215 RepID=UPI000CB7665D|nr:UvrD-helicase domain-containing protein [Ferrovibrio sp.]PJI41842.1 MAG: DNA helicase II [Ferrovibrio sp.]
MTVRPDSPAAIAAANAQEKVYSCIDADQNFRLEAGAGSGKTYSLVKALKRLIDERGSAMMQAGQQVACITFTEVARDEIAQEIERHPAILVETIHAFCWSFMAQFQKPLRNMVADLTDRQEKIDEGGGIGRKPVEYNLGFFGVDEDKITLNHDDIPRFMAAFLAQPKFRKLLAQRFPVIFIDEYQDTDQHFMTAVSEHFFATGEGPLIGLYGDHWQTIYRGDYGLVDFPDVTGIDKGANFRSASAVVTVLNKLRPELVQEVSDPELPGEARFFHTNGYSGVRLDVNHFKGDLPDDASRQTAARLRVRLEAEGWDFATDKTKVLMLTHSALAAEQGYPNIADIFDRNEAFAKKEDALIAFLADTLEPMFDAYSRKRFGEMFRIIGGGPTVDRHADKTAWNTDMDTLRRLRENGSIGQVLDLLKHSRRPRLPDKVMRREDDLERAGQEPAEEEDKAVTRHRRLREVPYREVIQLVRFLNRSTPFATQHSVKGAEFENVLVILGGGWNHYNWPLLLEFLKTRKIPAAKTKGYYRARNLFYVAISRPKRRLAVLATQLLSADGLAAAHDLFGAENIVDIGASGL